MNYNNVMDIELDQTIILLAKTQSQEERELLTANLLVLMGEIHNTPYAIKQWIDQVK